MQEFPSITDTTGMAILRDATGRVIRQYDILKMFHFEGRKRGKGYEKHYMYKIVDIMSYRSVKTSLEQKCWIAYHSTTGMLTNQYFVLHGDDVGLHEDGKLSDCWIIDSPLTLHEKYGC